MSDIESSDAESIDSDVELQEAFAKGLLKPGLNIVSAAPEKFINNVAGLSQKLKDFQANLDWVERLNLSSQPARAPPGTEVEGADVDDDFNRELRFYRQAQSTVLESIPKLHKLGVETKRPEDYFAQMAKTDDHMKRVREKLLEKQMSMDRSEKAKKLRELRKYGKKVQHEVLLKRQKEKREMLDAVKKFRKGQKDKLDFLEKGSSQRKENQKKDTDNSFRPNRKRQYKNKKFGFGGQKKRSKSNTAASSADTSDFNPRVNQKRPGQKMKKVKQGQKSRPGKSKRTKLKSRKR